MSWVYSQSTGQLKFGEQLIGTGYSGCGDGKNNSSCESIRDFGPIPVGWYTIGAPFDSRDHVPYVMHLTPESTNEMYGRGGFLIHGDSIARPGEASKGCIIMSRDVRERVGRCDNKQLRVIR